MLKITTKAGLPTKSALMRACDAYGLNVFDPFVAPDWISVAYSNYQSGNADEKVRKVRAEFESRGFRVAHRTAAPAISLTGEIKIYRKELA